ncbi:sulfotransferase domain-containing protein [Candidatus Albibeggiatoa sp. nov. NOAA]|uniref:sulfotransferase domain-containing protein n=1 Tax=Candidatus Albibeggiatoa sp. nov. NOAA TaxID=3162724 RepID=UPI0032FA2618|nr:sulfotransferase domain-containing protein [Thiotrichaceae bacterium]
MSQVTQQVDFLICGAQKAGTSALAKSLKEHPDIYMSEQKELHFFDNDGYFQTNQPNYENYHQHFVNAQSHQLWGEATPAYMYWQTSPQRMHQYNPHLKLIVILRNPIERAYSHWNMQQHNKAHTFSFREALQHELSLKAQGVTEHKKFSCMSRGFYSQQLQRIQQYFPKQQLLALKYDTFKNDPQQTLNLVSQFLQIELVDIKQVNEVYALPYSSQISTEDKAYLQSIFTQEIRNLESMLGWGCHDWLV